MSQLSLGSVGMALPLKGRVPRGNVKRYRVQNKKHLQIIRASVYLNYDLRFKMKLNVSLEFPK